MPPPRLDAALVMADSQSNTTIHLFKGSWMATYTWVDQQFRPEPLTTQDIAARWPKLAGTIARTGCDAAWYDSHEELVWLTFGNTLYRYKPDPQKPQLKDTQTLSGRISNLPPGFDQGIDAALSTDSRGYLFKGTRYCSYKTGTYAAAEAKELTGTGRLDATAWLNSGDKAHVYLFSGDSYHTATIDDDKANGTITVTGSPQKITSTFPGAPVGTPCLDLYFFHDTAFTRARTNVDLTTRTTPLPADITATPNDLGHKLSSRPDRPFPLWITPDRRAYVLDPTGGHLNCLDLTTTPASPVWDITPGGTPAAMTTTPPYNDLWITGDGKVTHVQIHNDGHKEQEHPVTGMRSGPIAVTPDTSTVYVVRNPELRSYDVVAVPTETYTPAKKPLGSWKLPPLDLVAPGGEHLWILVAGENNTSTRVERITTSSPQSTCLLNTQGLVSMAVTPDGAHVLVTQSQDKSERAYIFSATGDQPIAAQFPAGTHPCAVAIDPHNRYAYVTTVSGISVVELASPATTPKSIVLAASAGQGPVAVGVHWS
ncbi:hypothetical protein ACFU99_04490 [Streptomyces sp. NPDC057654]|uniref:hypothetical protein n=1 Tax=Streptomyces sp. NPDC057654 TaxID=3346196 RepID=UPI00369423AE